MGMFGDAFKKFATPDNLYLMGAGLKDIGNAGESNNLGQAQQVLAARQKAQQEQQLRQQAGGLFGGGAPNLQDPATQQRLMQYIAAGGDPSSVLEVAKALQPPKSQYIEGPNGIYAIGPDGKPSMVQAYPEKPNTTPGQINPQTGKWEWAPGYLEGQGQLTATRRDAVVARPMPSRGRSGGGGGRVAPKAGGGAARPLGVQLDPSDGW